MPQKILVVDEMVELIEIIAAILQKAGYIVLTAREDAEVLQKAARELPALILFDVFHSDKDWSDVCRQLKANPITKNIVIMRLLQKPILLDKAPGSSPESQNDLFKPISSEIILRHIKEILPPAE